MSHAWMRCIRNAACLSAGLALSVLSLSAAALEPGKWVAYPAEGLVVGNSGGLGPLAVCRAADDGGKHPGKLWQGQCWYEWGWEDRAASQFEVLKDAGYRWVAPTFGLDGKPVVPANPVDGGSGGARAGEARLLICQAYDSQDKTWHPGKYYAGACNIAWGGGRSVKKSKKRRLPGGGNSPNEVLILVK